MTDSDVDVVGTCPKCRAPVLATHLWARCGRCGARLPDDVKAALPALNPSAGPAREVNAETGTAVARKRDGTAAPPGQSTASALRTRYVDAYRVARTIDGLGATSKGIGFVLAGLLAVGSLMSLRTSFAFGVVGFVIAGLVAMVGFVLGVLVSAQGQILMATLDTSVNSSPFLNNEDRAGILGVPVPRVEVV